MNTLELSAITGAILLALILLWVGLTADVQTDPQDLLEEVETLEDRIREARSYMCDSDTLEQKDYEMLCRILDPENEYSFNLLNDF